MQSWIAMSNLGISRNTDWLLYANGVGQIWSMYAKYLTSRLGCSTICGHQMGEEICIWIRGLHNCGFPCLRPPRVSLVIKNKLLWVIWLHLALPKCTTVLGTLCSTQVFPMPGAAFLKSSRWAGAILGCFPFFILLLVVPKHSQSWDFLRSFPAVFLTWEFF